MLGALARFARRQLPRGSRAWWYALIGSAGLRVARRLLAEKPELLYRTEIRPGDRIMISGETPTRAG